jgi:hypothetical protein
MRRLVEFGPSAAFYIFALAAQMSGIVNPSIALALAAIATLLLFVPACHHSYAWHKTRKGNGAMGLDSWYFIAPCLALAMIGLAGAAYGFGLRSASPAAAVGNVIETKQSLALTARLINDARISWDEAGDIWLAGTYAKSGGELFAYVNVTTSSVFSVMTGQPERIMRPIGNVDINTHRIATDKIDRFDRGTQAKIKIARVYNSNGGALIRFGSDTAGAGGGIATTSYLGFIILVDKERNEDIYKFAVVGRMAEPTGAGTPPIFIGPDIFNALEASVQNAK